MAFVAFLASGTCAHPVADTSVFTQPFAVTATSPARRRSFLPLSTSLPASVGLPPRVYRKDGSHGPAPASPGGEPGQKLLCWMGKTKDLSYPLDRPCPRHLGPFVFGQANPLCCQRLRPHRSHVTICSTTRSCATPLPPPSGARLWRLCLSHHHISVVVLVSTPPSCASLPPIPPPAPPSTGHSREARLRRLRRYLASACGARL
jgi:hypothetical protein